MKNVLKLNFILGIMLGIVFYSNAQQLPKPFTGKIDRLESFKSAFVTARNVDIWLPQNYSPQKKYAVLYMHDGQMLFDSTITWNKQEWKVDEVITKLQNQKKIKDVIVVGVWNGDKTRHADYFPQKPFEMLTNEQTEAIYSASRANGYSVFNDNKINSDNYLKFLVTELKPYIDSHYPTLPDATNTFVAGSSMGGLISMYAICEYPDVFGAAACLSTHWPGIFALENNPVPDVFIRYMAEKLPDPKTHKIYFDYGTATLDSMYPPIQKRVDEVMRKKGFNHKNWVTKEFRGENHSEQAWSKRLDIPLLFLLGKK